MFFAAKDGEALYSQQKQDRELTVAQIILSSCSGSLRPLVELCVDPAGFSGYYLYSADVRSLRKELWIEWALWL